MPLTACHKEARPPARPPAPPPQKRIPPAPKTAVVTEGPLNLRDRPGTKATIIGRLNKGEKVIILGAANAPETIDGRTADWYQVETIDGKRGYAFGGYLDAGTTAVPTAAPPTAQTPAGEKPLAPISVAAASVNGYGPKDYYEHGKELVAARNYAEALPFLKAATELSPQTGAYWFELGLALQEEGRHEEAVTAYERAAVLLPEDFWTFNNLGLACLKTGRVNRAIDVLEKAVELEPKGTADANAARTTARRNLATAYELAGKKEEAERLREP